MSWFGAVTFGLWSAIVVSAGVRRGKPFVYFVMVMGGVYSLCALGMVSQFPAPLFPAFAVLHVATYLNFLALARPRMRSLPYRLLISWPSAFMIAGSMLGMPWAIAHAIGFHPWAPWLPYALAAIGLLQSLTTRKRELDITLGEHIDTALPIPYVKRGGAREERPLRIAQISDPHLGPFMSVKRLRKIAERAVAAKPDLVLLTGDFLTMESHSDPDLLLNALEPLKAMPGRVFACNGNHDHEAPDHVKRAMTHNGIPLLVDDSVVVDTDAGKVQIVGMDFVWRDRAKHLEDVCRKHPRITGVMRLVMLHDPGAFKHLPAGEGDLVLSGHTHGGQVGLLSLGLQWTFLRLFGIRIPDHGFWARGVDRMYVHSGTGHYGFPLRLGVPAEEPVLRVHRAATQ